MPEKRRVRGKLRAKNQGENKQKDIEVLSQMINASRAFRNLPPEMTMGKEYDR